MGLFDEDITYEYSCTNCNYCKCISTTLAKHSLIENCPDCNGHLNFIATDYNVSNAIDINKPKTVGSLAEKNTEDRIKRGQSVRSDVRQKLRDFDIVKDPNKGKRYIETGKK